VLENDPSLACVFERVKRDEGEQWSHKCSVGLIGIGVRLIELFGFVRKCV
jgi:hypothetical protein